MVPRGGPGRKREARGRGGPVLALTGCTAPAPRPVPHPGATRGQPVPGGARGTPNACDPDVPARRWPAFVCRRNALGAPDGGGPGGLFVLDHDIFRVRGPCEVARGPQYPAYDFAWRLQYDVRDPLQPVLTGSLRLGGSPSLAPPRTAALCCAPPRAARRPAGGPLLQGQHLRGERPALRPQAPQVGPLAPAPGPLEARPGHVAHRRPQGGVSVQGVVEGRVRAEEPQGLLGEQLRAGALVGGAVGPAQAVVEPVGGAGAPPARQAAGPGPNAGQGAFQAPPRRELRGRPHLSRPQSDIGTPEERQCPRPDWPGARARWGRRATRPPDPPGRLRGQCVACTRCHQAAGGAGCGDPTEYSRHPPAAGWRARPRSRLRSGRPGRRSEYSVTVSA
jgi:hypothetical protein